MIARRLSSAQTLREATVIGDNAQVIEVVGLLVGARIPVRVFTSLASIEESLAPYPGVHTVRLAGFAAAPPGLGPPPYFICLDQAEQVKTVRGWLPPTLAVFHAGADRHGRNALEGFLGVIPSPSLNRTELVRRLQLLRRLDKLNELYRHASSALILMYADPDPDAIGAALGLSALWKASSTAAGREGAKISIRYTGQIQRYQNRLLLDYLDEDIEQLHPFELAEAGLVAVVDAQPGFWKDPPPRAQVVIDHHPRLESTDATFVDLRVGLGSTSTILTEYLHTANVPIRRKLATALLYGLSTDTADLTRNVTSLDVRAFDLLHEKADQYFLRRLALSQIPSDMLDGIGWGISHRVTVDDCLLVHYGRVTTPDLLVQAADQLLLTCGIAWVVCAGVHDNRLVVVLRGDGHHQDVGGKAKRAFGKLGSAGGHRTMGRAEIPLGGGTIGETVHLLINQIYQRMSPKRRRMVIKQLTDHLGPLAEQAALSGGAPGAEADDGDSAADKAGVK